MFIDKYPEQGLITINDRYINLKFAIVIELMKYEGTLTLQPRRIFKVLASSFGYVRAIVLVCLSNHMDVVF